MMWQGTDRWNRQSGVVISVTAPLVGRDEFARDEIGVEVEITHAARRVSKGRLLVLERPQCYLPFACFRANPSMIGALTSAISNS